jgi:hypothetical protein
MVWSRECRGILKIFDSNQVLRIKKKNRTAKTNILTKEFSIFGGKCLLFFKKDQCSLKLLYLFILVIACIKAIFSFTVIHSNGKEATVNRALDGSTYPR